MISWGNLVILNLCPMARSSQQSRAVSHGLQGSPRVQRFGGHCFPAAKTLEVQKFAVTAPLLPYFHAPCIGSSWHMGPGLGPCARSHLCADPVVDWAHRPIPSTRFGPQTNHASLLWLGAQEGWALLS